MKKMYFALCAMLCFLFISASPPVETIQNQKQIQKEVKIDIQKTAVQNQVTINAEKSETLQTFYIISPATQIANGFLNANKFLSVQNVGASSYGVESNIEPEVGNEILIPPLIQI